MADDAGKSLPPDGTKKTPVLLLVEDNAADADLIREYLDQAGAGAFRCVHVTCLSHAVIELRSHPVDVVLLDLRLPDGTGVVNVKTIRAIADDVPIVVLTGLRDEELAVWCLDAGAQDYLCKEEIRPIALTRAIRFSMIRTRETRERLRLMRELEDALAKVLSGFIPICMYCKRIRSDTPQQSEWRPIEQYVEQHSETKFSHGICPECMRTEHADVVAQLGELGGE